MRFAFLALTLCVGLLPARLGRAQSADDERAKSHFQAGRSYYDAGDYEYALREFERAYELSERPGLFYNLSLCHEHLGHYQKAVDYLSRFLSKVEEIPNRATLERRLENLRERAGKESKPGAAGNATATKASSTGGAEAADQARSAESRPVREATEATAREPDRERRQAPAVSATTPDAGPGRGGSAPPPANRTDGGGGGIPTSALVSFVAAGAGLVATAAFGGLALSERNSVASGCGQTKSCTQSQVSSMDTYALISDIGLGVAAVGAALGVTFLLVSRGDTSPSEHAAIELRPWVDAHGGGGAVVGGRL